eukprot:Em0021g924a
MLSLLLAHFGGTIQDVKLTTANPPGCPQSVPCGLPLSSFLCPPVIQEDCLYLNVFTPLDAMPGSNYPVMFFIHGGNFLRGYSGGQLYDGQYIANTTSTVVVTANYRLGAIGYLVYGDSLKGNYGLKDQRLALEWVRDNIANFGGNPYLVTYWGQSAGAISGAVHMTSIKSAGLFHRAILESEPFGITLKNIPDAQKLGNDFAMALGCNDITCLYSKNITEIAAAEDAVLSKIVDLFHALEIFLQWTPVVDGVEDNRLNCSLLEKLPIACDNCNYLPLSSLPLMGTTSQESTFSYEAFPKSLSIAGVSTNINFLERLASHESFRSADVHTGFIPASAVSLQASAVSLQASAVSLQASAVSLQASAVSLQASAVSLQASAVSLQASAVSLQASAVSLQASAVSLQASAVSLQASAVSLQASAVSLQACLCRQDVLYCHKDKVLYCRTDQVLYCHTDQVLYCGAQLFCTKACENTIEQHYKELFPLPEPLTSFQKMQATLALLTLEAWQPCGSQNSVNDPFSPYGSSDGTRINGVHTRAVKLLADSKSFGVMVSYKGDHSYTLTAEHSKEEVAAWGKLASENGRLHLRGFVGNQNVSASVVLLDNALHLFTVDGEYRVEVAETNM